MTERRDRPGKPAPRFRLDGVEWKLAVATWLGAVYVVSWFSVREPNAPTAAAAPAGSRGSEVAAGNTQPVSYYERPAASPARSRPAARPGRIRTRSS